MRAKYCWLFCVTLALGASLSKAGRTKKLENINRQTRIVLNSSISTPETGTVETNTDVRQAAVGSGTSTPETETVETSAAERRATLGSLLSKDSPETNPSLAHATAATLLSKTEIKKTDKNNSQVRTLFDTSLPKSETETAKTNHGLAQTSLIPSSEISPEAADGSHSVTETTFTTISDIKIATNSKGVTETTFPAISDIKIATSSKGVTETMFGTSPTIPGTETAIDSKGATVTTLNSPFPELEANNMKDSHGLTNRTSHENSAWAESHPLADSTAENVADTKMTHQGGLAGASLNVSIVTDTTTDDPKAVTGEPGHLQASNNIGGMVVQAKQILDSVRTKQMRPKSKSMRKKTLDDKKPDTGDECDHDDENSDEDDLDYDQDEDIDSIYTLAHFRHELYAHVEDLMMAVNESVLDLVTNVHNKVKQLENQQTANSHLMCRLQSMLQAGVKPKRGDIRILTENGCLEATRIGYLQFYTGSEWGFICDDFFDEAAVSVACRQLGLTRSDATDQLAGMRRVNFRDEPSFDRSWENQFTIVLDDVLCAGEEIRIDSCFHSHVGRHDCSMDEIVFLAC